MKIIEFNGKHAEAISAHMQQIAKADAMAVKLRRWGIPAPPYESRFGVMAQAYGRPSLSALTKAYEEALRPIMESVIDASNL